LKRVTAMRNLYSRTWLLYDILYTYIRRLQNRRRNRELENFLNDLLTSAFITISFYFIFSVYVNNCILNSKPNVLDILNHFFHFFCLVRSFIFINFKFQDPSINNLKEYLENLCTQPFPNFQKKINEKTEYGISSNPDLMNLMDIVNTSLLNTKIPYFLCYRTLIDVLHLKKEYQRRNIIDLCLYQTVS